MNRVLILGTCGSGKTTLAKQLSEQIGLPHIELDGIFHQPNWQPLPADTFRTEVQERARLDRWVIEGNYSVVRDLILERADTIVWLDYSYPIIFRRLWRRCWHRLVTKEELWNGNREELRNFLSLKDSILIWQLKTYRRRKRQFCALFADPSLERVAKLHFSHPTQTERWLSSMT